MSRAYCLPAVLILFFALLLNLLVSISLPYLPTLYIARTHIGTVEISGVDTGVTEIRVSLATFH